MMTIAWLDHEGIEEVAGPLAELEKVSAKLGNKFFIAWCCFVRGIVALRQGELAVARLELERSVDYSREVGDPATGGIALAFLGEVDVMTGNFDTGRACFVDLLGRADGTGDMARPFASFHLAQLLIGRGELDEAASTLNRWAVELPMFRAWLHCLLGSLLVANGEYDAACHPLEVAREASAQADNLWLTAMASDHSGRWAHRAGNLTAAENWHHHALSLRHAGRLRAEVVTSLDALAAIAVDRESPTEALRLFGAADVLARSMCLVRLPDREMERREFLERARQQLDDQSCEDALAEGSGLTVDEAVAYASRARGERKRPSYGWDSLTPTEERCGRAGGRGTHEPPDRRANVHRPGHRQGPPWSRLRKTGGEHPI